jgi:hypothetical protein
VSASQAEGRRFESGIPLDVTLGLRAVRSSPLLAGNIERVVERALGCRSTSLPRQRIAERVRCAVGWFFSIAVLVAAIHGCAAPQASQPIAASPAVCPVRNGPAATQVIHDLYAAFTIDDATAANRLLAPDFVAFDAGKRFTGPGLFAFVKAAHDAGKKIVWNLVDPKSQVACDVAWLWWENRGTITDASGATPIVWNESAVLRWVDDGWRVAFFHSSRAAEVSAK